MKKASILFQFLLGLCFNLSAQWHVVGSPQFTSGAANSLDLKIDNAGTPYVAFKDGTSLNKATVMKYNGTNWVVVGSPGFSIGAANNLHLAIDKYDSLYIVYSNASDSNLYVMKFNGINWYQLGALNFKSTFCNIAVDTNCMPYIASITSSGNLFVKSYSAGIWTGSGFTGFGIADENPLISIDKAGTPYVAYHFHSLPNPGMELKKYVSSSWTTVSLAQYNSPVSLKINNAGQTFLAFIDNSHNYEGVMTGTSTTYTTSLVPYFVDMDIDSSSTPCLLFPVSNSISVEPAVAGSTPSVASFNNQGSRKIAFDKSNTLSCNKAYLAFNDTGSSFKLTVISIDNLLAVNKNKMQANFLSIYPNPSAGQFIIETNSVDKFTVDLNDLNGRQVFSAIVTDKSTINVAALDNGIYTMTIKSTDYVTNKKLVIVR